MNAWTIIQVERMKTLFPSSAATNSADSMFESRHWISLFVFFFSEIYSFTNLIQTHIQSNISQCRRLQQQFQVWTPTWAKWKINDLHRLHVDDQKAVYLVLFFSTRKETQSETTRETVASSCRICWERHATSQWNRLDESAATQVERKWQRRLAERQ